MDLPNFQRIGTSIPATAQAVIDVAAAVQSGMTVKLATAAALPAGTYSNTLGTFTVTATGTLTVDGVVTALNDTILVKDQVSTFQNGLYYVSTAGAVGVSAVLTRMPGWTTAASFQAGACIGTGPAGTANPSKVFQQTSATCATLGTDAITYGLAVTTAPDAATGTKGITKMSVAPASAASPIAVGTNDPRVTTVGIPIPLDATDGSFAESTIWIPGVIGTITAASLSANAAITQSDTDYLTFTVGIRNGSGGAASTVASKSTKVTGGGAFLAFQALTLGSITNPTTAAASQVTFKSVASGAGQASTGPAFLLLTYTVP
jgi:hypothetical protein